MPTNRHSLLILISWKILLIQFAPNAVNAASESISPAATEVWVPVPPEIVAGENAPPSDAITLFNGTGMDAWEEVSGGFPSWTVSDHELTSHPAAASIRTKRAYGDVQLHLEFRSPTTLTGDGQDRGNSGIFFMGLYELQILDSHKNPTYVNGQAGSIYKQYAPLVNSSRAPGEWQKFDVVWRGPVFSSDGTLVSPARMTVFHNGVLIQDNVELKGPTLYRGTPRYEPHPNKLPLGLQAHRNAVSFRNIWIRELAPR